MQNSKQIVHEAISNSLLSLGEPIMKTIVWHLNVQGVFLDSQTDLPIGSFYKHLVNIIGNIADEVMEEIFERIKPIDNALAREIQRQLSIERGRKSI